MRPARLLVFAVVVVSLAGLAWWLLERDGDSRTEGPGLVLPRFAARVEIIDRIEVAGAGDKPLVLLEKKDGQWHMPDRDQWPGNQREIGRALFRLGQAKRIEAKTANPKLHGRLGVEDVAGAEAKGTRLMLSGGGEPVVLVVGNNHPALGGSYVRIGDSPQVWLLDEDIAPARNAADWLDRRLLDIPMARIDTIRVAPSKGRAFVLSRVDDRFSLDGSPPTAMGDPDAGNATAGFTDQLPLDDVAKDSGAAATQTVVFEGSDGVRVTVAAWRQDDATWARLQVELDEARAAGWFAQAGSVSAVPAGPPAATAGAEADAGTADASRADATEAEASPGPTPEARLDTLRRQVADWQSRFQGRQFLLPPYKAESLMKSRDDYLAGSP